MISLCIPTYNCLPDLERCLNSMDLENTHEVIIADSGSTYGTLKYLRELNHKHVKLIEQGKLTGITKGVENGG